MGESTGTNKRRGRPENLRPRWKPGESGNPGGRPKGKSMSSHLQAWGDMTPTEAAELCAVYAKQLREFGDKLTLKEIATLRMWVSQISEPSPSMMGLIFDRTDGPVKTESANSHDITVRVIREDRGPADGA
jgi:hypothetical protein